MKRYEAEIELTLLYTVPIHADSLEEAAEKAKRLTNRKEIAELGEVQDHEPCLVGVSRQVGRKLYQ